MTQQSNLHGEKNKLIKCRNTYEEGNFLTLVRFQEYKEDDLSLVQNFACGRTLLFKLEQRKSFDTKIQREGFFSFFGSILFIYFVYQHAM